MLYILSSLFFIIYSIVCFTFYDDDDHDVSRQHGADKDKTPSVVRAPADAWRPQSAAHSASEPRGASCPRGVATGVTTGCPGGVLHT